MFDEEREEQWDDEGAICPYCGHLNKPEDDDYQLYDQSIDEFTCNNCDKSFLIDLHISYSWWTRKKND